jgi:hypothetical protein
VGPRISYPAAQPAKTRAIMEHEQERHEKHEEARKQKQAEERQSEQRFSLPGPTIRPLWFLALGFVLVLTALFIWWQAYP